MSLALSIPRARTSPVLFSFDVTDCLDELGVFGRSYGRRVAGAFTRASRAEVTDQNGRSVVVASGMPQLSAEFTGSGRRSALLLEPSGTPGWTLSEDISNAAWSKVGTTVTGPFANSNGVLAAYRLVETAATATHYLYRDVTAGVAGNRHAIILDVRPRGRHLIKVYLANSTTQADRLELRVDLNARTITQETAAGTAAAIRSSIEPLANGFVRLRLAGVPTTAVNTYRAYLILTQDGANDTYAGDGASGVDVEHFGFEALRPVASSRMRAAVGARALGALQFSVPALNPARAMTMYLRGIERGTVIGDATRFYAQVSTNNPRWNIVRTTSGAGPRTEMFNGVTSNGANLGSNHALGSVVEFVNQLASTGVGTLHRRVNGGALETAVGSALTMPDAWSEAVITLNNSAAAGGGVGYFAFLNFLIADGVRSPTEMFELAGVG